MDRVSLPLEMMGVNLPYSIEAEQAVLGAVIVDSASLYEVAGIVIPEHFYHSQNSAIFREMNLLFASGKPVDFVTVLDAVVTAGVFENEQEAKVYLFGITETVPSVSNAASYARIVHDKYLLRSLISASREIMSSSSEAQESASSLLDFAEQRIYNIRTGRDASDLFRIDAVIMETLDRLNRLSGPDRNKYIGLPTGFRHLDRVLTGLNRSDLIIIAARPGVGKTSFALNIASNIAKSDNDCSIAFFSLEMTTNQLAARILSSEASVASQSFRTGEMQPDDWVRIAQTTDMLARSNLYLDDTSGISVNEIKAKARRLKNLGLIIVDYLQLMGGSGRSESRVQEISDITRAFKIMGKELNVPIVLLSQLSRSNEKQARRPMLSDLRDSGSIEQDSDIVMFLHRERQNDETDDEDENNEVLLMVSKNRHGETTNIRLHWDGKYTKFTSMEYVQHA